MTAPNTTTLPQDPAYSPGYGPGQPKTLEYQASDYGRSQADSGTAKQLLAESTDPSVEDAVRRSAAAGYADMLFGYDTAEDQATLNARRAAFVWPPAAEGNAPPNDATPSIPEPVAPASIAMATELPAVNIPLTPPNSEAPTHLAVPVASISRMHQLIDTLEGDIAGAEHWAAAEFRSLLPHAA